MIRFVQKNMSCVMRRMHGLRSIGIVLTYSWDYFRPSERSEQSNSSKWYYLLPVENELEHSQVVFIDVELTKMQRRKKARLADIHSPNDFEGLPADWTCSIEMP